MYFNNRDKKYSLQIFFEITFVKYKLKYLLFDFTFVNSNLDIICIVLSISATLSSVKLTKAKKNSTPLAEQNIKSKHDKKRRCFVKINRRIILTKRRFAKIKRRFISVKTPSFLLNFSIPYSAKAKAADKLMPAAFFCA